MNLCLIGGIYGTSGDALGYLRVTPETTLEAGLRRAGHIVTTMSHYAEADFGQFDAVHVHHLSYGALRLACDSSATPFVFTPHDASEMSGTRLSRVRAQALGYVLSRADRVVALSGDEARFLQRERGIEANRVTSIPNGIDTGLFPFIRKNDAGRDRPWQLLFVGQLIPLKRCDRILRAVATLGSNIELTLIYQTADLEAELRALAASLGIAHRLRFLGRREPRQLAETYQRSDLLVLASQTEALPSVISEAMLSGLPFISTAVGGIREQANGFGHLIEGHTAPALATGIQHVLDQYAQHQHAAAAMSAYARDAYSIDGMVNRHVALYQRVTSEAMASRGSRRTQKRFRLANALTRVAVRRMGTRVGARSTQSSSETAIQEHTAATERP